MIEHACGRGMRVNISSNGRDPDQLAEIMRRFTRAAVGVSVNDHATLQHLERFLRKHRPIVKTVFSRTVDHKLIEQVLALAPQRYYLLYRDALGPGEIDESLPFDRFLEAVGTRYGSQVGVVFCSGFIPDLDQYPQLRMARCPGGRRSSVFSPTVRSIPAISYMEEGNTGSGTSLPIPSMRSGAIPRLRSSGPFPATPVPGQPARFIASAMAAVPRTASLIPGNSRRPNRGAIEPDLSGEINLVY